MRKQQPSRYSGAAHRCGVKERRPLTLKRKEMDAQLNTYEQMTAHERKQARLLRQAEQECE